MLSHVVVRTSKRILGRPGRKSPKAAQVLRFLALTPGQPRHYTVIAHCLGYFPAREVEGLRKVCEALEDEGRLQRPGKGQYCFPEAR